MNNRGRKWTHAVNRPSVGRAVANEGTRVVETERKGKKAEILGAKKGKIEY